MNQSLGNRRVVVTGGFGILGRAVGDVLRSAGARVALIDKSAIPPDLPAGFSAQGGTDLGQESEAREAIDHVAIALEGLDALVNVAGGFQWQTVEGGSIETWDRLYALNVRTAFLASQAALPHLLASSHGRIVNVGAISAASAVSGMGAYAAAKSGVARLTEAMAEEFKDRGITVNAVLPGILDTPANRIDMPKADATRWVDPAALAQVIGFLLSDLAAPITGALIPVKGRL